MSELRAQSAYEMGAAMLGQIGRAVLLKGDTKHPLWYAWQRRKPSLESILEHIRSGQGVGVVPSSVGMKVVDVDTVDLERAASLRRWNGTPLAVTPTRRGSHLWYEWDGQYGDDHESDYDVIRDGYVVLYDPLPVARVALGIAMAEWEAEAIPHSHP